MVEYVIEIEKEEHDVEDLADYLEYVAKQLREGFTSGDSWDLNEVV
jgi:hypothetical protein